MRNNINGQKYRDAPPRLIERILTVEYEVTAEGCWLWPLATSHDGYAHTAYRLPRPASAAPGQRGKTQNIYVHRLVYMHFKGDPGDTVEVDHSCHKPETCTAPKNKCPHRRCFNPDHLEALTTAENLRRSGAPAGINSRKTHCDNGHEFTPGRTSYYKGTRVCLECARLTESAKRAVRRAARIKFCKRCGVDISSRAATAAIYCEACNPPRWRGRRQRVREARERAAFEAVVAESPSCTPVVGL